MPLDVSGHTLSFNCQAMVPGSMAASLHIQLAAWWGSGASLVHASTFQTNLDVWGERHAKQPLPVKIIFFCSKAQLD